LCVEHPSAEIMSAMGTSHKHIFCQHNIRCRW